MRVTAVVSCPANIITLISRRNSSSVMPWPYGIPRVDEHAQQVGGLFAQGATLADQVVDHAIVNGQGGAQRAIVSIGPPPGRRERRPEAVIDVLRDRAEGLAQLLNSPSRSRLNNARPATCSVIVIISCSTGSSERPSSDRAWRGRSRR